MRLIRIFLSIRGHRTDIENPLLTKKTEKNASKNIKNETRSKADVCADTQDFSTLEGQPAGQPTGQLTGQPAGQPEGHKQEAKNDKKKDQHLCSTELSGCDQVEPAVTDNILSGNVDGKRRVVGKQAGYVLQQHLQETFDIFWAAYPKKRNKGDAKKAWEKIQPNRELLTNMLTSLERAKTCLSWTKDNGQYVPYPASWLRAEGWEDEIKTLTTQPKPPNDRRRET